MDDRVELLPAVDVAKRRPTAASGERGCRMKDNSTIATQWHRKPKGHVGPCPVCGLLEKGQCRAWHRLVSAEGDTKAKWLKRKPTRDGWVVSPVVERNGPFGPKPGTIVRAHRPTARIAKLMGEAVALIVHGKSVEEAATVLNTRASRIWGWQHTWKDMWQMLVDKTAESLFRQFKRWPARTRIFLDPNAYMGMARYMDDWAKGRGVNLFPPPDGEMTLSRFFVEWYLPQRLFDAKGSTRKTYAQCIKTWRLLTGDPPVAKITPDVLALFRDAQLKMRGLKRYARRSPNSVRGMLRMIQTLLDKLGSPGRGNRDALDILSRVPWVLPPKEVEKLPRTVSLRYLSDCYLAAVAMEVPRVAGIKPPAWWRALLTVAWNTGLRRGTLFSMRWDEVDWKARRLVLPAARMKSRRPMVVHLNERRLSPYVRSGRIGNWCLRGLGYLSSVSSTVFRMRPDIVQGPCRTKRHPQDGGHPVVGGKPRGRGSSLGHTTSDVTRKHYVDGGDMVARAFQLPQPDAFNPKPRAPGQTPRLERRLTP